MVAKQNLYRKAPNSRISVIGTNASLFNIAGRPCTKFNLTNHYYDFVPLITPHSKHDLLKDGGRVECTF